MQMIRKWYQLIIISSLFFLILGLSGCTGGAPVAPVVNAWNSGNVHGFYRVLPGDTLYSVAWRFGLDYRDLAKINHIRRPYEIYTGQLLKISVPKKSMTKRTYHEPARVGKRKAERVSKKTIRRKERRREVAKVYKAKKPRKVTSRKTSTVNKKRQRRSYSKRLKVYWRWPTKGKVIEGFSIRNKGIDIAGKYGQPVMTTAPGVVVYAGSGLLGYGKLLIIKHSDDYLSAYAHNSKLLVKEGQRVRNGQVIARMGNTGSKRVMLHFEIRRAGKPVNPLKFLSRR